ncbi:MAG: ankyrin repeat domain-containing protein [Lewinellaceae bacterium]|nr:ankyrin repeat domain-containing protein [Lewinellaceae bacterium]
MRTLLYVIGAAAFLFISIYGCLQIFPDNEKALFRSVDRGDFDTFQSIVEEDHSLINVKNERGTPLLIYCLEKGQDSMARELLKRKADASQKDADGLSALFYPLSYPTLQWILNQGVDVNARDSFGSTPLHFIDSMEYLNLFIKTTRDRLEMDAIDEENGMTPLMLAIVEGKVEKVRTLAHFGADIHYKSQNGLSCIDHARIQGNPGIIKILEDRERALKDSLRIAKIFEKAIYLAGSSHGANNTVSVSDFTIPDECDELIVIGYSGQTTLGIYGHLLSRLEKTGVHLYGEEAESAYKAIKAKRGFSEGNIKVDFFITSRSNGSLLRNNPDAAVSWKYAEIKNAHGFNKAIRLEDGFSTEKEKCAVVKNRQALEGADFKLEIFCVVRPEKQPPYTVTTYDQTLNPSRQSRPLAIPEKLSPNTFYSYPSFEVVHINAPWFIQGAAKWARDPAERLAALYDSCEIFEDILIFKKGSGEAPFKVLIEAHNDRRFASGRMNYIREHYSDIGDLRGAFVVSQYDLFEYRRVTP